MKRILFLLSLGAGMLPAATVTIPSCSSLETFQDLINAGQCTSGIFTVKNPTVNSLPEGISASDILITVSATTDNVNFSISGAAFTSSPFGGFRSFNIGYTFDPPPDIIKGVSGAIEDSGQEFPNEFDLAPDLNLGPAAADIGDAVFVQYSLCAGAAFTRTGCDGDTYGFSLSRPDVSNIFDAPAFDLMLTNGVVFAFPVNTVGVQLLVELRNGGFLGPLTTGFPVVTDVPEPATMGLAGIAGLTMLWARRRRG